MTHHSFSVIMFKPAGGRSGPPGSGPEGFRPTPPRDPSGPAPDKGSSGPAQPTPARLGSVVSWPGPSARNAKKWYPLRSKVVRPHFFVGPARPGRFLARSGLLRAFSGPARSGRQRPRHHIQQVATHPCSNVVRKEYANISPFTVCNFVS